jgi:hypothetical protein
MLAHLIALLLRSIFGANLKRVPPPPLPSPAEILDRGAEQIEREKADYLDPEPPTPPAPRPTPNILVPDPANIDRHGPASAIARALVRKSHAVFEKDENPRNLNIVAIRTANPEFDRFRCRLVHFEKHKGQWSLRSWPITTLPGDHYTLVRLLNPAGVAILAPGQYRGAYALDRHRGIYEALCQRNGPVRVYRDGNRNRVYDMNPATIQSGMFGINIHSTENPDDGISRNLADRIGSASAGCLVFARVTDFVEARKEWREARTHWGPRFTVTLIDDTDLDDFGAIPHESVVPQHSEPESWQPPSPGTVGTRNRNLLNVKQGREPWKYSTGKDGKGHAIFPNFASGIRAGIGNLRTYWTTHGIKSPLGIANRWAPSNGTIGDVAGGPMNQPNRYADFIARRMGIKPTDTLMTFNADGTVRSADQLFALVSAMVEYENGVHVKLPRSVFDAGLSLL